LNPKTTYGINIQYLVRIQNANCIRSRSYQSSTSERINTLSERINQAKSRRINHAKRERERERENGEEAYNSVINSVLIFLKKSTIVYLLSTKKRKKIMLKSKEEKGGKEGLVTERASITGLRHRRSMRSTVDDTSRSNVVDDGSPSSSV
jgi:hypothetical protein